MERRDTVVSNSVPPSSVGCEDEYLYNGIGANLSTIELFVCVPPDIRNAGPVDLQEVYLKTCRPSEYTRPAARGRGRGRGGRVVAGR
jgi:hypothetical protein